MKTITLRLKEDLHKEIKIKTVKEDTTMQDYILSLIKEDLDQSKKNKKESVPD